MKSGLQQRAEEAAERFGTARKPVVVEFAGVPKAGKSTTIGQIQAFLKRCGFSVEVVVEHASTCPIRDKKHEQGYLPVEGASGSIMNEKVLRRMLDTTRETAARLDGKGFRVFEVDTSGERSAGPGETAERVADLVLRLIEEQLEEEILSLPADAVAPLFDGTTWIGRAAAQDLVELFTSRGGFESRESVESDAARVQALPVVVVRNRSGEILRLKRREQRRDGPLHGRIVIWAGGHVRREDGANGPSIGQGAVRELQEELRISVGPSELKLLGAVWIRGRAGDRTRRHLAIVHEWRARTDDVAVALSATEFYERRGTSLSGTFVAPGALAADIDAGRISEPWSVEIFRRLLPEGERAAPRLV